MTFRQAVDSCWAALGLLAVLGCGGATGGDDPSPAAPASEFLEVPYTADQIRDEWRPGFTLVLHFNFPDRQQWQRWTVVDADPEGAEIQYQELDDQGQPVAPPQRSRSSWAELRDHARFPTADARRERVTRATALGELDGWLYQVHEPKQETMTDFFFADELPGAPVWFESSSGGQVILTVHQIARQHLAAPPVAGPETAPAPG